MLVLLTYGKATHIHTLQLACAYVQYAHTSTYMHTHACTHAHTHACTYTCTHTHTHTHTTDMYKNETSNYMYIYSQCLLNLISYHS